MTRSERLRLIWANYSPKERKARTKQAASGRQKAWETKKLPRHACKHCGRIASKPHVKYCSWPCMMADRSWRKGPPKKARRICQTCGKECPNPRDYHCSKACLVADPKFREQHIGPLLKGQKIAASPACRQAAAEKMTGREQTAPLTAKGPGHVTAVDYRLRDPDGSFYEGRNISDFVRTHPDLFDPNDVDWYQTNPEKPIHTTCRATKGLHNLYGVSKYVRHSWKGWTTA